MITLTLTKPSPKTLVSIIIERKHKLEKKKKHICNMGGLKRNKKIDIYKTQLEKQKPKEKTNGRKYS